MSARTLTVAGGIVAGPNGAMLVTTSTINGLLVNQGTLVAQGNSTIAGSFMGTAGSTLRVQGSPSGFASLTVTSGLTNNGLIEITEVAGAYGSQLTVSGTLTNAVGATITSLVGAGGARTLSAELNNQGTLTVSGAQGLTLSRASAASVNSGTIDVTGGSLTITQSGTTPSLTNTGTLNIAATRTLGISGGVFDQNAGTLTGTGTLSLASLTWNLTPSFTNAPTSLGLSAVTVNGPGTLTNASLQTLTASSSTINAPLVNQGTLITQGTSTIAGSFTASAGSTLRAQGSPAGFGNLTVSSGFTNNGLIEITEVAGAYGSQLTVNGTLTNAVGATITSLVGAGGARTLSAELNNQGTLTVSGAQGLTLSRASAASVNSGTIDVTGGSLTITQSGTTPSLTNTGTLNIAATRTLGISGGVFDQNAGTLTGTGTLSLASLTWNLTPSFTNAPTSLGLSAVTVNGPGTLTNASLQTLTASSSTINAPLVNQGTLITQGTSTIAGSFTASAGSTLRAQGSPAGFGNLTVSSGFTNNGLIEITEVSGAYGSQLTVSGTLVNAVGGTVRTLTGSGGSRTLVTSLDNDGTLSLTPGAAGTLTLTGSLSGDGSIDMDIGGLTAGSQHDRLNMSGALTLGNTFLNVLLFGGFTPVVGNSFTIMTFASATGGFAVANLPSGFGPYQLNATTLVVSVPLP